MPYPHIISWLLIVVGEGERKLVISDQLSVPRPFVASEPVSDVRRNVVDKLRRYTRIRRPFVASED